MKKGCRNLCNGETSTSTLDQQRGGGSSTCMANEEPQPPLVNCSRSRESHPTLEEMILQLEMEENTAKTGFVQHRMSCVNSSDILKSARNALNQYPRFSLDGKDAMYRSSFTNLAPIRARKLDDNRNEGKEEKSRRRLCGVVGGESVIWCKPGIVAKLMGLDAMPIPLNSSYYRRERLNAIIKRQNLRKRVERHEFMERRRRTTTHNTRRGGRLESCSRTGYCVMNKPVVELDNIPNGEVGWPIRRLL